MTAVDVIHAIVDGELDDQLDAVIEAVRQRRRHVQQRKALENQATMTPGTDVVICGRISPKYLVGERGVVMDKPAQRSGDIMIEFPRQIVFRRGLITELGIPANCLRVVT